MQIPTNISKRIAKQMKLKSELQTPFIKDSHEWITNTYFMVRIPKTPEQTEDTTRQTPIMKIAEDDNTPKTENTVRLDIQYLLDTLEIMKANGTTHVDIKHNDRAIALTGLNSPTPRQSTIDIFALLMAINK